MDPSFPTYRSVKNRLIEAFKEPANTIGLAGAAALSAALLNPIPLLVGLVAEAAYLLFVPDSKWFTQRLEAKFDAEVVARREDLKRQVYPQVRTDIRVRFARLEEAREQILSQSNREEKWFREALRKLDFLMEKFLVFAAKEAQFCNYLMSLLEEMRDHLSPAQRTRLGKIARPKLADGPPPRVTKRLTFDTRADREYDDPPSYLVPTEDWVGETVGLIQEHYDEEMTTIKERAEAEEVLATRSILEKRHQVLERRHQFVGRMGMILTNLGHQMQLMSDTFGLINDEIRARSPEQVLADIDEVVNTTASLTAAIDEITPTDELVASLTTTA